MKNQKGFAVLEGLLILAIIGIIGGAGWYVWNSQNKTKDSLNNADKSSGTSLKITKKPTTQNNREGSLIINELKIKVTLPESLKDLVYQASTKTDYPYLAFSTKKLIALDATCGASSSPDVIPALGHVSKVDGKYPSDPTLDNSVGALAKQFPTFYIGYVHAQAACSDKQDVMGLQTSLSNTFIDVLKSAQEVK